MTPQENAERFSYLLAQRLREMAHEQGVGQNQLAQKSGVSQSQISRVFKHERAISVDQFAALCRALGSSASRVVREVEESLRPAAKVTDLSALRSKLESGDVGQAAALNPGYPPQDEQDPHTP